MEKTKAKVGRPKGATPMTGVRLSVVSRNQLKKLAKVEYRSMTATVERLIKSAYQEVFNVK